MSVVTATIICDKKAIDKPYELLSVDVRREVNRIPHASLVLLDGNPAKRDFVMSGDPYFAPGKEIEIKLRYQGKPEASVFKGKVVRHGVEANVRGSLLKVEIKDVAVKLTQTRKGAVYEKQSDNEVISDLIKKAGLKAGTITTTQPKQAQSVLFYCSDWDYIVSRAETYGLVITVNDGEVAMVPISLGGAVKHTFDWGKSELFNFEFEIDANHQYTSVKSSGWDIEGKSTQESNAAAFALKQGDVNGAAVAKDLGFDSYKLSHPVDLAPEELKAWADARMMRMRMAMIRGRLSTTGIEDIKLLDMMEISGVGKRFSGKTLVTGICHRLDADGWRTDIQFGLPPHTLAAAHDVSDTPAAGLLPGAIGLQLGIVNRYEDDPDKKFRVKVLIPGIDPQKGAVWARLAAPDAGAKRGYFFRPEVGDEVVVGFFNQDPRQPVILGALHSSKYAPPDDFSKITEKNLLKGIVTKAGTKIVFNDDKKASLYFETASKNKILLDDDNQLIAISDQHGNKITMDQNGIKLESAKDLSLIARGNVEIKGSKVDVK